MNARDLPDVIASVHGALVGLNASPEPEPEKPVPHMPIKKTIGPDYLISLEDGRRYKSLKRHLGGRRLTPQEYREKWGLPSDYPMVAQSYAAQRSALAKQFGLGRKASGASDEGEAATDQPAVEQQEAPRPKARSRARWRTEPAPKPANQPDAEVTVAASSEKAPSKAKPSRRSKGAAATSD